MRGREGPGFYVDSCNDMSRKSDQGDRLSIPGLSERVLPIRGQQESQSGWSER